MMTVTLSFRWPCALVVLLSVTVPASMARAQTYPWDEAACPGDVKWEQSPTFTGLGDFDGYDDPSECPEEVFMPDLPAPPQWSIVADDFICEDPRPISSVHWLGSYNVVGDVNGDHRVNAADMALCSVMPAPEQCDLNCSGFIEITDFTIQGANYGLQANLLVGFVIRICEDQAGPGDCRCEYFIPLSEAHEQWVGSACCGYPPGRDLEYEYCARVYPPCPQTPGERLWLSIFAVSSPPSVEDGHAFWGWLSRPYESHEPAHFAGCIECDYPWDWLPVSDACHGLADMCFAIDVDLACCSCPGDLNPGFPDCDNIVNVTDFTEFGAAYLSAVGDPNYNVCADLSPPGNPDGYINVTDATVFISQYLEPCPWR